jgi:hypothetical protein
VSAGNPYNIQRQTEAWFAWERSHTYDAHWHAWDEERDRRYVERERHRIAVQREKIADRKRRKAEWVAGVSRIMAEVRRREAEHALPEPPFYSSANPLDGTRLWDNS